MHRNMAVTFDWNDVRVVLAVAECGSFRRAAASLGVDQGTVSRRIAHLEDRSGVPLFQRRTRGAEPTAEGTELVDRARAAAIEMGAFEQVLKRRTKEAPVSVAAPEGLASYVLGPAIATGLGTANSRQPPKQYSLVNLVQLGKEADIEVLLIDRGADLPRGSDFRAKRIGSMRMISVSGRRYLATLRRPVTPASIREHALVQHQAYETMSSLEQWNDFIHSIERPRLIRAQTSSALHQIVKTAGGITLLPNFSPEIDSDIQRVEGLVPEMFVDVFIVAHPDALRSPSIRTVFDSISRYFLESSWFNL